MTDTATGEMITYRETWWHTLYQQDSDYRYWHFGFPFNWSVGNWACDCNRSCDFDRAKGIEDGGGEECTEGRYRCESVVDVGTGNVLYKDDGSEWQVEEWPWKAGEEYVPKTSQKPHF